METKRETIFWAAGHPVNEIRHHEVHLVVTTLVYIHLGLSPLSREE
jgi:hypothetical protein